MTPLQILRAIARSLRWRLNLVLFLGTLASTTVCGVLFFADVPLMARGSLSDPWALLRSGLAYSLPVILILGSHEMGHYIACRRYGVAATLPYFIPAPFLFGTMGAVIRMKPPIPGRRALFDIGVAGPIAGFVVALPVLIYGIGAARLEKLEAVTGPSLIFGDSLLVWLVSLGVHGVVPNGWTLISNPPFVAGWFGLLVTAMNLFPVGQLDGGHVTFAVSARLHRILSRLTIAGLVGLVMWTVGTNVAAAAERPDLSILAGTATTGAGILLLELARQATRSGRLIAWAALGILLGVGAATGDLPPWLVWMLVLLFFDRFPHPPVAREQERLGGIRSCLALLALAIFVLSFMPFPISFLPGTE